MTAPSLPPGSRAVLRALLINLMAAHHTGRQQGISAARLAQRMGVAERVLRLLISDAREEGIAIVGTPDTGYFVAQTPDELEACCRFLRARAMHSLVIEARLRQVALPELLGQLLINT